MSKYFHSTRQGTRRVLVIASDILWLERLASLTIPPLTTLHVDKQKLGRVMVELVFEQIEKRGRTNREVLLRAALIVRESTPFATGSPARRIQSAAIKSGQDNVHPESKG
jgi:Periplasmic binding protein-like domain